MTLTMPVAIARFLLAFTVAAIFAASAAAITLDNRASQGVFNATPAVNSLTWTHTVNSCTNCVLYIAVTTYSTVTNPLPVISVNYTDSSSTVRSATSVGTQASPIQGAAPFGQSTVQLYRIVAPIAGTGTISVTSSVLVNYLFGSSYSFNGVNQTTPDGGWNSTGGSTNSPSLSVLGGASGSVILDVLGSTPTAGFTAPNSGQTVCATADETTCSRGRRFFGNSFDIGATGYRYATDTVNTSSWQITTADAWTLGAVALTTDGTTAAEVSLEGQLLTGDGKPVASAVVYAQDNKGNLLTSLSNPFGYFKFEELTAGETYIISVYSKTYDFPPKAVTVNDSLAGVQLISFSSDAGTPPASNVDGPQRRPAGARRSADRPVN